MRFRKRELAVICTAGLFGVVSAVAVAGGATFLTGGEACACRQYEPQEARSILMDGPAPVLKPDELLLAPVAPDTAAEEEVPVEEEKPYNPYEGMTVSEYEKELLARMAYTEARGEPFEGQVAVVQVALNRVLFDGFGDTVEEVLLAPNQFVVGAKYGEEQMEAVEAALAGHDVLGLDTGVVYFSTGKLTCGSYFVTIGGHEFRTAS